MNELIFIHCGDIHLDARFTATGMTDRKAKERRQELRDVFIRIIDEVIKQKAQLLLISGDLFEHEYVSRNTIEFIASQFNRISNVKVFISPGNHDPYVANSYYCTFQWPVNVHIFTNVLEGIYLQELDVVVYGVGFSGKYQYESMLGSLKNIDTAQINILLTHGTLDNISPKCPYHPIMNSEISQYGFEYAALGHIHKMTECSENRIVYCGSPEPLGFDEPGDHGIIVGKVSKTDIVLQFAKMNKRECITQEINISDLSTADEVEMRIKERLKTLTDDIVHIRLTGRQNREMDLDVQLMTSRLWDRCFYLKITDNTYPDYHLEELCKQYNLKGIFTRKILQEIEKNHDAQMKEKLFRALYLGLDALSNE
ncbi:MAG: repair protein SbcD/Mre11 [Clostridiales bacterium]|nr:repair protein SbcD/Mre11 [Clostridiales bacterium]